MIIIIIVIELCIEKQCAYPVNIDIFLVVASPKPKINTPKRDNEHPRLFHMGVPPPGGTDTSSQPMQ